MKYKIIYNISAHLKCNKNFYHCINRIIYELQFSIVLLVIYIY